MVGDKRGLSKNRRGQVTIFIIIAIIVVGVVVLAYFLFPKIRTSISTQPQTPNEYIDTCIREEILNTIEKISLQGGSYETGESDSYFYRGDYIKYLCYTNENFVPCVNQEAFLKEHFENEILNNIEGDAGTCLNSLVANYENDGYEAVLNKNSVEANIIPGRNVVIISYKLSLKKGEETQSYENTTIDMTSNIYEILNVANNIVTWEISVGDTVTESYEMENPYIKVEKNLKEEETKLYIITDRNTKEVFRFAVRSFASPPGYSG